MLKLDYICHKITVYFQQFYNYLTSLEEKKQLIVEQRPESAAVLEHRSSRYDNIEKELRVPSYVRRGDVKFVTDNAGSHKAVYNEEPSQATEAVDNSLF